MRKGNTKKKKRSIFLRIALLAFSVYVIVSLVQLQLTINDTQAKIDEVSDTITEYQHKNEDLQDKLDNEERTLHEQALEDGYVEPGADVYKEIP